MAFGLGEGGRGLKSQGGRKASGMLRLAGEVRHSVYSDGLEQLGRSERLLERLDRLAVAGAADAGTCLRLLLTLNLGLAALFVAIGQLVFGDRAELFRELMPGTWLSFAELVFV